METVQSEQQKDKFLKMTAILLDNTKHANLCIIEIPEEEREKGTENVLDKIMAKSIPNLKRMKQIIQGLEAQSVPNKMNPNRSTAWYIIKMAKVKDKQRILKAAREKQRVIYKFSKNFTRLI